MKTTLITILLVFYVLPNCCYGQLADTLTKKDAETVYKDTTIKDNFNFGFIAGLGTKQGFRIGLFAELYNYRFGIGYGGGASTVGIVLFKQGDPELVTSYFIEFPKILDTNFNFGCSYSRTCFSHNYSEIRGHLGLYANGNDKISRYCTLSVGIGYDRIVYSFPTFYDSERKHFIHFDVKAVFTLYKGNI